MDEPVWLLDLDGTLLEGNSFPVWVRYLLVGRFPELTVRHRIAVSARCVMAILKRKLLHQSHAAFKKDLQRIWASASAGDSRSLATARLVEHLVMRLRRSLLPLIEDAAAGRVDAVLTTAAVAEYAVPLAQKLGLIHVVATPLNAAADWAENVGETKRSRTLAYLDAQGWSSRPRILLTDHRDDLPLIGICTAFAWFGDESELERVRTEFQARDIATVSALPHHATRDWIAARTGIGRVTCM